MKINHHGSRTSTSQIFLDSLRPEAVVISVGDENEFRHPAQETLDRLQHSASVRHIYQTETGSDHTVSKARVLGTVTIAVFDTFYTIRQDTFRLLSHQLRDIIPTSASMPEAPFDHDPIAASVENDFVTLLLKVNTTLQFRIINVLGQEVAWLPETRLSAGVHHLRLPMQSLPSGVYFVRITGTIGTIVRKTYLLR